MAKASPDSWFGIAETFPTSARNLGTSGPLPRTGTFQDSPYTESEPPGTCPKLSRPKALDSLRHHLPSPVTSWCWGESIELLWKNKLMYPLAVRWHHHRNPAGKYLGSKFLSEPSNIPPGPSPHPEPKWIKTLVEDPKAAALGEKKQPKPRIPTLQHTLHLLIIIF